MSSDLRSELMAIYQKLGHVNPRAAVLEVESGGVDSYPALYQRLEWDNDVAGPEYRVVQMRHLVKSIRVRYPERGSSDQQDGPRAFYAVPATKDAAAVDDSGYTWTPVEEVISNPMTMKILRREMEREVKQLRARYGHLESYAEILQGEIDAIAAG